jgi:hypothetical protein
LPLSIIVGWVIEKCPDADPVDLRREFEFRLARYRDRRRS